MAFHTNDTNPIITLSNYEEYLLLYVDGELTPAERALVEAFLQFHPELQAELDLLLSTKLEPEGLQFLDKENLFAQSMLEQIVDENLLLYVDGELDENAEKEVARKLEENKASQEQYQWLLRTKSDPAEGVPYPNKEELYRRTVRRMGLSFALRIAAAVLLLASMGVLYLQQDDAATGAVASIPKKPIAQKRTLEQTGVAKPGDATAAVAAKKTRDQGVQQAAKPGPDMRMAAAQPARNVKEKATPKNPISAKAIAVPEEAPAIAYEPAPVPHKNMPDVKPIEPSKKDFEPAVTYNAPQPYIISEAAASAGFAAEKEDDGRNKGNLKSLLRKATRMVERRTGINATNEDEELLIGVVALKLK